MWHDNAPSAYLVLALGNWLGGVTKVTKLRPLPVPQRDQHHCDLLKTPLFVYTLHLA
jgi:hypothetical protein